MFLAALPYVRDYHRAHGVPAEVSRRTLADLGRHMTTHRERLGTGGLLEPGWLKLHFRGEIYQLGRLQFQRRRLGRSTGEAVAAAGLAYQPTDGCLEIHIPARLGPLTLAACDESLAEARAFFDGRFPGERYRLAACKSWLLDPQLADYLGSDSNIIRFQRRFQTAYDMTEPDDAGVIGFVFGDPTIPVDRLPRRTTLERAITDHLLAGHHWYGGRGWFEL